MVSVIVAKWGSGRCGREEGGRDEGNGGRHEGTVLEARWLPLTPRNAARGLGATILARVVYLHPC